MNEKAHHAMAFLHGAERAHAEANLRESLETLATCTTAGGDRWYNDEELETYVQQELEDVLYVRDEEE